MENTKRNIRLKTCYLNDEKFPYQVNFLNFLSHGTKKGESKESFHALHGALLKSHFKNLFKSTKIV